MESNPRIFIRRLAIYALVCVAAAVIISIFIIGLNRFFIIGTLTGCLLIIYKSVYWWNLPVKLTGITAKQKRPIWALLLNIFIQLMTGLALLAAVLVNVTFFYGMAAGMLAAIAGTVAGTIRSKQWRA